jgi:hypothetical protein
MKRPETATPQPATDLSPYPSKWQTRLPPNQSPSEAVPSVVPLALPKRRRRVSWRPERSTGMTVSDRGQDPRTGLPEGSRAGARTAALGSSTEHAGGCHREVAD